MFKINIDRLECSYYKRSYGVIERIRQMDIKSSETFGVNGEVKLYRYYNATYMYAFDISIRTEDDNYRLVGKLKFDSSQKSRKDIDLLYITFENRVFYETTMGFTHVIKDVLGIGFKEVVKLDVCCDSPDLLLDKVLKLYKGRRYDAIINGKLYHHDDENTPMKVIASGSRNNPYKTKTVYIQDSEGATRLRVYDKREEQEMNDNNKPYQLVDDWETQHRMEIVLPTVKQVRNALASMNIVIDDEMELANKDLLKCLFESELKKIIRFNQKRSGLPIKLID